MTSPAPKVIAAGGVAVGGATAGLAVYTSEMIIFIENSNLALVVDVSTPKVLVSGRFGVALEIDSVETIVVSYFVPVFVINHDGLFEVCI